MYHVVYMTFYRLCNYGTCMSLISCRRLTKGSFLFRPLHQNCARWPRTFSGLPLKLAICFKIFRLSSPSSSLSIIWVLTPVMGSTNYCEWFTVSWVYWPQLGMPVYALHSSLQIRPWRYMTLHNRTKGGDGASKYMKCPSFCCTIRIEASQPKDPRTQNLKNIKIYRHI